MRWDLNLIAYNFEAFKLSPQEMFSKLLPFLSSFPHEIFFGFLLLNNYWMLGDGSIANSSCINRYQVPLHCLSNQDGMILRDMVKISR